MCFMKMVLHENISDSSKNIERFQMIQAEGKYMKSGKKRGGALPPFGRLDQGDGHRRPLKPCGIILR